MTNKKEDVYQQQMLSHHKQPVGFEMVINATAQAEGENANCGDEITILIEIDEEDINRVKRIAFNGDSCAICRASASILCQQLSQQFTGDIEQSSREIISRLTNSKVFEINGLAQAYQALSIVNKYPIRKQCAVLPWTTLQAALTAYKNKSE